MSIVLRCAHGVWHDSGNLAHACDRDLHGGHCPAIAAGATEPDADGPRVFKRPAPLPDKLRCAHSVTHDSGAHACDRENHGGACPYYVLLGRIQGRNPLTGE